ncbi:hypothetical protein [Streptomyces anulatus]|uniref:Helix-turn-helix domain-containing protein n=1 Tax=Streptomyces anulatus TaxID=1892 RepID=A0ABZ1ZJ83_STRAQ|nr:hypothetical protein [Streptomyces anulatus]
MSSALLATAEPRRTRGGASSAVRYNRPRRRSEQSVWIPESLYRGDDYNDEAAAVYIKVAALDARRTWPASRPGEDPCTARVAELAAALGMSPSAVERGLTQLNRPGPEGEPWLRTKQRTHRGGDGRSALRYARLVPRDQAALEVPVRVAEALTPRRLRAWLHLARATAKGLPVTGAELAGELFHHTGEHAGERLCEKTGRRLLDDLEAAGWLTLGRRAGHRARHAVTVNTSPLHSVPAPTEPAVDDDVDDALFPLADLLAPPATDIHDGVGPDDQDGSLATREDNSLTPDGRAGNPQIRRRRDSGSYGPRPVENPVAPTFQSAAQDEKRSNNGGGTTYRGPGLQLSPRVWQVLEPVRHELPGIQTWVLRRIGQEIGEQLSAGVGAERLTTRLLTRYSRLTARGPAVERARRGDVGRWILGAGLPRHGCRLPSCEDGITWATRERCHLCANIAAAEAPAIEEARAQQPAAAAPPDPPAPVRPPTRWLPWPPPPPDPGPEPPGADEREQLRAAATGDTVRQALAELGAPAAIRLYGRALVLPHLATQHDEGTTA